MNAERELLSPIKSDEEIPRRESDRMSTELSPSLSKELSEGGFNLLPRLSRRLQERGIIQSELESPNYLTRKRYRQIVKIQPKCPIKKFRREDNPPRKSRRRLAFGNSHNHLKSKHNASDVETIPGERKSNSHCSGSVTKEDNIPEVCKVSVDGQDMDALPSIQKSTLHELGAKSALKKRSLSKPPSPASGFLSGVSYLSRSSEDSLCASIKPLKRSPKALSSSPLSAIRTSTPVDVRAQLQWEEISSLTDSGEEGSWLPLPLRRSSRFFTSSDLQISSLENCLEEEQSPKKENRGVSLMNDSDKENHLPLHSSPPPKLVSTEKARIPLAPLSQLRRRPKKRVRSPSSDSSSSSPSPNILSKVKKLDPGSKGSTTDEEPHFIINSDDFELELSTSGSESCVSNNS